MTKNDNVHVTLVGKNPLPIMQVVYLVLVFAIVPLNEARLSHDHPHPDSYFQKCIGEIIQKYFDKYKQLSIVDMNSEHGDIVKIINDVKVNTILLKKSNAKFHKTNEAYFITAGEYMDFCLLFPDLVKKFDWNPHTRFIVMIKYLVRTDLREIFDLLLVHHVYNVLVMDESADPELYTYNPFEEYGCGQRYDRIIEYGKCSVSRVNLYPYKLVTGLRNCTFKVACSHEPPYVFDPAKNMSEYEGVEEFVLKEIGTLENFQLKFTYADDGDVFTELKDDAVAFGPLYLLQNREVDIMLGTFFLTHQRAKAFDYLWAQLAYLDEFSYQVKKATTVAPWKNIYLEFDPIVWTVLIFAFLVYFLIFVILVRPKDKGRIALNMVGFLLDNGNRLRGCFFTRYLFIHWVVFAYIINVYYVSNLVSLTTNPLKNYQVSNEEDLIKYKLKPCVCNVLQELFASVDVDESIWKNDRRGCENQLESIDTVSKSNDLYTLVEYSLYKYYEDDFLDANGDSTVYTFNNPLAKATYAIYLYKGFPMLEKLHTHTLRLRESGLIDKHFDHLYYERRRKTHNYYAKKSNYNVYVPWYILLYGYSLCGIVFVVEVIVKKIYHHCDVSLNAY